MPQLKNTKRIVDQLAAWYREEKRDLPWRNTRDPYAIWVSEIMLQQTQVETVLPYYRRWMREMPTVGHLAEADPEHVLKLWEGLGYYSRARNMQRAAEIIVSSLGGRMPASKEALLSLPGIGPYTAGALLSIAFGQRVALVDGNIIRVITRLFRITEDTGEEKTKNRIWSIAQSLVPENDPGTFNQALMELGATVCLPKKPRCLLCPLAESCRAYLFSDPALYPKKKKSPVQVFAGALFLIENRGRFLVEKRKPGVLMGGLWQFPSVLNRAGTSAMRRGRRRLLGRIKAAFTKFRGTYEIIHSRGPLNTLPIGKDVTEKRWCSPDQLKQLTLSAPSRKAIARFLSAVADTT